jgi:hypothetical protein
LNASPAVHLPLLQPASRTDRKRTPTMLDVRARLKWQDLIKLEPVAFADGRGISLHPASTNDRNRIPCLYEKRSILGLDTVQESPVPGSPGI